MKISPRVFSRFPFVSLISKVKDGTRYVFQKHLLLTNITISATLSSVGDCIQQHYELYQKPEAKYSLRRTFNMGVTGITIGVVCHYWYIFLDTRFAGPRSFKLAMKKMLLDQIICSPVTIGVFFVTMGILNQESAQEFLKELKCKSWRLYLAEWIVWPPAQLINFFFLPLRYRVLYDNTISMCYDIYTSQVKHEVVVDCEEVKQCNRNDSSSTFSVKSTPELPRPLRSPAAAALLRLQSCGETDT